MSDRLAPRYGVASLRYALMATFGAAGVGIVLFLYAARRLPRDLGNTHALG
jgi:hypothetical protein